MVWRRNLVGKSSSFRWTAENRWRKRRIKREKKRGWMDWTSWGRVPRRSSTRKLAEPASLPAAESTCLRRVWWLVSFWSWCGGSLSATPTRTPASLVWYGLSLLSGRWIKVNSIRNFWLKSIVWKRKTINKMYFNFLHSILYV